MMIKNILLTSSLAASPLAAAGCFVDNGPIPASTSTSETNETGSTTVITPTTQPTTQATTSDSFISTGELPPYGFCGWLPEWKFYGCGKENAGNIGPEEFPIDCVAGYDWEALVGQNLPCDSVMPPLSYEGCCLENGVVIYCKKEGNYITGGLCPESSETTTSG